MDVVLSPSNLKVASECLLKFHSMQIAKDYKKTEKSFFERGKKIHKVMENAVNFGWDKITYPEADTIEAAKHFIDLVWSFKAQGWEAKTELSCATDGLGQVCDYWDKPPQNFLRCQVDVYMSHPESDTGIIIDWKTGKPWDDTLQVETNALCLFPMTGKLKYETFFVYLDSGVDKHHTIELDITKPKVEYDVSLSCKKTCDAIRKVIAATETGEYPYTPSNKCRWCDCDRCPIKGGKV